MRRNLELLKCSTATKKVTVPATARAWLSELTFHLLTPWTTIQRRGYFYGRTQNHWYHEIWFVYLHYCCCTRQLCVDAVVQTYWWPSVWCRQPHYTPKYSVIHTETSEEHCLTTIKYNATYSHLLRKHTVSHQTWPRVLIYKYFSSSKMEKFGQQAYHRPFQLSRSIQLPQYQTDVRRCRN